MQPPRVFISRELSESSPLRAWADKHGYSLEARSLLNFAALNFTVPPDFFDWVFFYSPRAVAYFCATQDPTAVATRIAAIGGGTARALIKLGHTVDFCGKGTPDRVARDFLSVADGRRVLFPQALQSRRSVAKALGERINATEIVVYQNEMAPPEQKIPADLVIFTSPLNVRSWFTRHERQSEQSFLAIGPSTAAALAELGIQAAYPEGADEWSLVRFLEQDDPLTLQG